MADLEANGIEAIDLVVTNLYPFSADPSIELIDIGGPRWCAQCGQEPRTRRHRDVATDYAGVLAELRQGDGSLSDATRRRLARAAFAHTAAYDAAIVAWLDSGGPGPAAAAADGSASGADAAVDADDVAAAAERRSPPSFPRRCT